MKSSIFDALTAFNERNLIRLHTPGHKGKLCGIDLTELTDDSFPGVIVENVEKQIVTAYGCKQSHMLCGGSSQGVKSAIYYSGVNAIVDKNSHRAVFDGFKLSGKRCVKVGSSDILPITVKDIDKALTPDMGAVVVTTPTYYGFVADLAEIRDYCKKKGLLFIADSAHGAHFGFNKRLPDNAIKYCDIANESTHKTLSALTQSALLLDNLDRAESKKLHDVTELMGTTSPSYLLYASIEHSVNKAVADEERYEKLYSPLTSLRKELPFLNNDDFTRLVLDCEKLGVDANSLNSELCRNGVYSELNDGKRLVFIFTAEDDEKTVKGFYDVLIAAVDRLK